MVKSIKQKLQDLTNVDADLELIVPRLSFNSNQQALIDGAKGLLEYDDSVVKVNCGKIILKFQGENLSIKAISLDQLIVNGDIISLEFLN